MTVADVHPSHLPALFRAVGWIDAPVAHALSRPPGGEEVAAATHTRLAAHFWLPMPDKADRRRGDCPPPRAQSTPR